MGTDNIILENAGTRRKQVLCLRKKVTVAAVTLKSDTDVRADKALMHVTFNHSSLDNSG